MKVLITGGAGYIGSTVASACEDAGHSVVILDNFSTGRREFVGDRPLYEGDIADDELLDRLFSEQQVDAVVHCAAKIIVPESVAEPLAYYENNVSKTITLLAALQRNRAVPVQLLGLHLCARRELHRHRGLAAATRLPLRADQVHGGADP